MIAPPSGRHGLAYGSLFSGLQGADGSLDEHSSIDHLNRKSSYGFTPLDLALEFGDDARADYLRQLGAKTS